MKDEIISPNEKLLTLTEASEYMRCSKMFLWKKRREGQLKYLLAGKKVLIRKGDIDTFLQAKKEGGPL